MESDSWKGFSDEISLYDFQFIDHIMAGMEGITKHSSHNLMRIK